MEGREGGGAPQRTVDRRHQPLGTSKRIGPNCVTPPRTIVFATSAARSARSARVTRTAGRRSSSSRRPAALKSGVLGSCGASGRATRVTAAARARGLRAALDDFRGEGFSTRRLIRSLPFERSCGSRGSGGGRWVAGPPSRCSASAGLVWVEGYAISFPWRFSPWAALAVEGQMEATRRAETVVSPLVHARRQRSVAANRSVAPAFSGIPQRAVARFAAARFEPSPTSPPPSSGVRTFRCGYVARFPLAGRAFPHPWKRRAAA